MMSMMSVMSRSVSCMIDSMMSVMSSSSNGTCNLMACMFAFVMTMMSSSRNGTCNDMSCMFSFSMSVMSSSGNGTCNLMGCMLGSSLSDDTSCDMLLSFIFSGFSIIISFSSDSGCNMCTSMSTCVSFRMYMDFTRSMSLRVSKLDSSSCGNKGNESHLFFV